MRGVHELLIAIDGPAGAGKSTVGRALAARLGLRLPRHRGDVPGGGVRGVAPRRLRRDDEAVAQLARTIDLDVSDDGVYVDGDDVTTEIRGREVTAVVSAVAANPGVAPSCVPVSERGRHDHGGGVIEGRDIGTVVFPDAALKLFITASPQERAARRVREIGGDVDDVAASIAERDRRDMTRLDGPLRSTAAVVVDTTGVPIDAVVDTIVDRRR